MSENSCAKEDRWKKRGKRGTCRTKSRTEGGGTKCEKKGFGFREKSRHSTGGKKEEIMSILKRGRKVHQGREMRK